jgi:hypothetical protein
MSDADQSQTSQREQESSQPVHDCNQRYSDRAHVRRASATRGNLTEGPKGVKEG